MDLGIVSAIFVVLVRQLYSFSSVEASHVAGLSFHFYDQSCPQAEAIVRAATQSLSAADPTTPSALLRLMFHDCQVQGCDGSILVDRDNIGNIESEMDSSKNFGIRKREAINLMKSAVEAVCPGQVSCADIVVMAARDAVAMSGGPRIEVPLGRRDSSSPPSARQADAALPPANLGVDGVLADFVRKGLTIEESVAILGAHTLGVTHCFTVQNRLKEEAEGHERNEMGPGFATLLRLSCPLGSLTANTSFVFNDPTTLIFDNRYYINASKGRGTLRIDAEMPLDPRTAPYVLRFAAEPYEFFRAFSLAFLKLSSLSVLTGSRGVIRRSCNVLD